ncbi:MAG: hypothetical protein JNL67_19630 [Planctomycetaceae bacterium]|nr:hypothetical protein [Planctomycetaceae bacterium]
MRRDSPIAEASWTGRMCHRWLKYLLFSWLFIGLGLSLGLGWVAPNVMAQEWSPIATGELELDDPNVDPAGWMQAENPDSLSIVEGPGGRVVGSKHSNSTAAPILAEGSYFDTEAYPMAAEGQEWSEYGPAPLFPNRPYLVPRLAERLRWRPLFPNRPYLRGSWPGGPPLEQPRTFWLNPFAVQQGLGNFLFRGNQPADTGSLGFPFSVVPSHLVDRVPRPYLGHGQPYIGPRHIDRGQPLFGTSWVNRPYFIDGYTGALFSWNLTENLDQTHGTISGLRLGWDYEHFWGAQIGMGFGSTNTDPGGNDVSIRLADVSVMYYPWGDSRWRPYTGLGLGAGKYSFLDETGGSVDEFAMQIPLSLGIKYAFRPWWALRVDATNYFVLPANELKFMNQLALTLGLEIRFGGQRRSYFPYSPSIQLR